MSAYMVSESHVNALVNLAVFGPEPPGIPKGAVSLLAAATGHPHKSPRWSSQRYFWKDGLRRCDDDTAEAVGAMLLRENRASINWRYDEHEDVPGFTWHPMSRRPTALEGLKAVKCYVYQACEHPGWETSEAAAFCDALTQQLITSLPGYDEAEGWSWDG